MADALSPVVALVPLRAPGKGKTRLSEMLDPSERAILASAMLADVAHALRQAPIDRTIIVASDAQAGAAARALGLDVTLDPPSTPDLNAALQSASGVVGTAGTLLVVAADLPRLKPSDVEGILSEDAQVVVAPTDDGGTGGLLRRPPTIIGTAYGPQSSAMHLRLGHGARARTVSVDLPGFRTDVDTWEDLQALANGPVGRATARFLERLGPRLHAPVA